MKSGDRIKLVNDNSIGIVVDTYENGNLDIELEDGFTLTVHYTECMLVNDEETESIPEAKPTKKQENHTVKCYIEEVNNNLYLIVNNKSKENFNLLIYSILYNFYRPIHQELLIGNSSSKIQLISSKETILHFKLTLLKEYQNLDEVYFELDARPRDFIGSQGLILYPFPREESEPLNLEDAKQIQSSMLSVSENKTESTRSREIREVDLHLEKLVNNVSEIPEDQRLTFQLGKCETAITKALDDNLTKLVLIHGKGEGVLRDNIHFMLRRHPNVSKFEQANILKYGAGATLVHLEG